VFKPIQVFIVFIPYLFQEEPLETLNGQHFSVHISQKVSFSVLYDYGKRERLGSEAECHYLVLLCLLIKKAERGENSEVTLFPVFPEFFTINLSPFGPGLLLDILGDVLVFFSIVHNNYILKLF
jgi:hypothetical protein